MLIKMIFDAQEIITYLEKSWDSIKPIYAFLTTVISYVIFPDEAYIAPFISVSITVALDIITKYYAISKKHRRIVECGKRRLHKF